jgi:hypothetical protein
MLMAHLVWKPHTRQIHYQTDTKELKTVDDSLLGQRGNAITGLKFCADQ